MNNALLISPVIINGDWTIAIMAALAIILHPYWSTRHRYWAGLLMLGVILLCWFPILPYRLPVYFAGAFSRLSWISVFLLLFIWIKPFFNKLNADVKHRGSYRPLSRTGLLLFWLVIAAVELSAIVPPPYTISATTTQTDSMMSFLHQIWLPDLYRWGYFTHLAPNPPLIDGQFIFVVSLLMSALLFWQQKSLAWILWLVLLLFSVIRYVVTDGGTWERWLPINMWDVLIDPLLGIAVLWRWWQLGKAKDTSKNAF